VTIYTNVGFDPRLLAEQANDERMRFNYETAMAAAELKATIDSTGKTQQAPEVVRPGQAVNEFSFDSDEKKQISAIREARAYGSLRPRQIVQHDDGQLEYVYDGKHPVQAFAQKLFCIRCRNSQPETEHEAKTLHDRLSKHTDYRLPAGMKPTDCCCFCGAILGGRAA
jgi:hypothetical protein